jgi:prepilin-type N-terminal cleavage/methylation domain-containing protein
VELETMGKADDLLSRPQRRNRERETAMIERLQAKRNEEGFTLIELLIVIIVLGILAAIVVFAVASTKHDSVAASCKTDVKSIELSAEAVNVHASSYPAGLVNSLNTPNPLISDGSNGALLKAWPSISNYFLQYSLVSGAPVVNVFPTSTVQDPANGKIWTDSTMTVQATPLVGGCTNSTL